MENASGGSRKPASAVLVYSRNPPARAYFLRGGKKRSMACRSQRCWANYKPTSGQYASSPASDWWVAQQTKQRYSSWGKKCGWTYTPRRHSEATAMSGGATVTIGDEDHTMHKAQKLMCPRGGQSGDIRVIENINSSEKRWMPLKENTWTEKDKEEY